MFFFNFFILEYMLNKKSFVTFGLDLSNMLSNSIHATQNKLNNIH